MARAGAGSLAIVRRRLACFEVGLPSTALHVRIAHQRAGRRATTPLSTTSRVSPALPETSLSFRSISGAACRRRPTRSRTMATAVTVAPRPSGLRNFGDAACNPLLAAALWRPGRRRPLARTSTLRLRGRSRSSALCINRAGREGRPDRAVRRQAAADAQNGVRGVWKPGRDCGPSTNLVAVSSRW